MSMRNAVLNFNKQFDFEPEIENKENLKNKDIFLVAGMGGSHWAADIIQTLNPAINIVIHSDYDLSSFPENMLNSALIILSSYSGNTEETLSVLAEALERKFAVAAISVNGKLAELASINAIPYVRMPDTGIQPRSALGFSIRAMLKVMRQNKLLDESKFLSNKLDPASLEGEGKNLAKLLRGKIPVIYSSATNRSVAFNWKIKFNETGKIPAFANVFPELNHNEMTGFDVKKNTEELSRNFHFIFLKDESDHTKISKRMEIAEKLYSDRGLAVTALDLKGDSKMEKIFSSLVLADWAAYYTADNYGLEPEQVPMVEEFKKMIAD